MQINVVLFGWKRYKQPLLDAGLNVYEGDDFDAAASVIRSADEVKVLLFDRYKDGGAGYDLAQVLRATHGRSLVGRAIPSVALRYWRDAGKPLPNMMDFWLGEPFEAADIVEQVSRYNRGESGPPAGWNGWFTEPEIFVGCSQSPEVLAWEFDALVEEMRRNLTPDTFEKWHEMIKPGIEARLQIARSTP